MSSPQIPLATYRLQFNEHFRLADALALVPYFHELGISHIYASPLFKAAPHSSHGYDVCDFNQLNPELGTEADLKNLADALHDRLQLLGPEQVLARGYSITTDADTGKVLRDAATIKAGQRLKTRLKKGEVVSKVEKQE